MASMLEQRLAADIAKAASVRRSLNCCPRCALRFAAIRDAGLYTLSNADLEQRLAAGDHTAAAEATSAASGACPLCVGCLEACVNDESIATLAERATAEGYEMRSFAIAVSLPVSLLVRQRAGWLHLDQLHREASSDADAAAVATAPPPPLPFDRVVELKDAFRWVIAPKLAARLSLTYDPSSAVSFHISASSSACDAEHHEIVGQLLPPPAAGSSRKRDMRQVMGHPAEVDSIRSVTRALALSPADGLIRASRLFPPARVGEACLFAATDRG